MSSPRAPGLVAAASALGGMIVGSVVGIGVQVGAESTGLLGPSVESLLAEQESNFVDINARLDGCACSPCRPPRSCAGDGS